MIIYEQVEFKCCASEESYLYNFTLILCKAFLCAGPANVYLSFCLTHTNGMQKKKKGEGEMAKGA